jgi:hypothetical protein
MEKSPCKLNLLHCRQNYNLFMKWEWKGNWKTRKIWSQANSTWYNTQGWDMRKGGGGGGVKWRDSGKGGGWGWTAPLHHLISGLGEMVWQYIYFSTLIKKGTYSDSNPGDSTAALHPYIFATPFAKKCTPFFHQSLTRESFSRSLFCYNFPPFLNKCQLFMSKDFWNLPVNPVRRVPGFMKEGKADSA